MPIVDIYNIQKEKVGELDLKDDIFGVEVRGDVLHEVVTWQRACRRSGCACTKTRGEVSGGGRKPWRQKGTGRARSGSNRSPIWKGGGTTFGPRPRSYAYALPKKVRAAGPEDGLEQQAGKRPTGGAGGLSPQRTPDQGFCGGAQDLRDSTRPCSSPSRRIGPWSSAPGTCPGSR